MVQKRWRFGWAERCGITVASLALGGLLGGCGGGELATIPVTGKLTCQGKPVAGILIQLSPADGSEVEVKPASGVTDAEGRFELTTYEEGDGAVAATHRVGLSPQNPDANLTCAPPDDLTFEVSDSSGELNIDL